MLPAGGPLTTNGRNVKKGKRGQARTHQTLGGQGFTPYHEESGLFYDLTVRPEVKADQMFSGYDRPGAVNRAWTEIEHTLVEQSAQAPLTNPVTKHAVSDRVGNVQVNPQSGLLPSLMWVQ